MEAKGRKMLALGVVAMMCAVAIIGVGYAAFSNTANARTYNENNSTEAGYMVLSPSGTAITAWTPIVTTAAEENFSTYSYQHVVDEELAKLFYSATGEAPFTAATAEQVMAGNNIFYSETGAAPFTAATAEQKAAAFSSEMAYYFEVAGSEVNSLTAKSLGTKTFSLENQTGASFNQVTFKVTSALVGVSASYGTNADFKYFLKVQNNSNTPQFVDITDALETGVEVTLDVTAIADGASDDIVVTLYVGYDADVFVPNSGIGDVFADSGVGHDIAAINSALGPEDMKGVSFGFAVYNPVTV